MAPHSEALNHAECKTPRTFMGLRPNVIFAADCLPFSRRFLSRDRVRGGLEGLEDHETGQLHHRQEDLGGCRGGYGDPEQGLDVDRSARKGDADTR